jgi:hypothetical protein
MQQQAHARFEFDSRVLEGGRGLERSAARAVLMLAEHMAGLPRSG